MLSLFLFMVMNMVNVFFSYLCVCVVILRIITDKSIFTIVAHSNTNVVFSTPGIPCLL